MNCAKCGAEISDGAESCRACGAPVSAAPAAASESAAPPAPRVLGSRTRIALIVAAGVAVFLLFASIVVGGYFAAEQFGLFGRARPVPAAGGSVNGTAQPATGEPTTSPRRKSVAASDTVLDLKDAPSDPTAAALRHSLLAAARAHFSTTSMFFVNQIWVEGDVAVGEIGAEHGGHRIWVVWRGTPWRVVWSGDWGVTDASVMTRDAGQIPPELLGRIDWTKSWPKEFKFVQ